MQLGVWNQEAGEFASHAGLLVVMNRCAAIAPPRRVARDA
jgi:predicted CoA-binding protein